MRKNIRAIFVISALVALVLCSACVFTIWRAKEARGGTYPGYRDSGVFTDQF